MFGNNINNPNGERIFHEIRTNLTESATNRTCIIPMHNRTDEEEFIMEHENYNEQLTNSFGLAEHIDFMSTSGAKLLSLDEAFAKNKNDHKSIFNRLTISDNDHKNLFNEDILKHVYDKELDGKKAFRFNPNKTQISDLTGWKVDDGCGIISIQSTPSGFFYTDGISPIGFKARLGYSQSLKRNICIAKLFTGRFVVPDYLFFRGYLIKEKKNFSRNFNLSYVTVADYFSFDATSEYPDSEACDTFFQLLALALMGELDNHQVEDKQDPDSINTEDINAKKTSAKVEKTKYIDNGFLPMQLAERFIAKNPMFKLNGGRMYTYGFNGSYCYSEINEEQLSDVVFRFFKDRFMNETSGFVVQVTKSVRIQLECVSKDTIRKYESCYVACRNVIIDLENDRLIAHTPDILLRYYLDVDVDFTNRNCPVFDQLIEDIKCVTISIPQSRLPSCFMYIFSLSEFPISRMMSALPLSSPARSISSSTPKNLSPLP